MGLNRYLLDTNVWIELLRRRQNLVVLERLEGFPPESIATSAVVKGELVAGALKSGTPQLSLEKVESLLRLHTILPFDEAAAGFYGSSRADLERRGIMVGHNDLLIAATALRHDLTLVTHNVREFSRVPGLRIEDWQGPTAADPLA